MGGRRRQNTKKVQLYVAFNVNLFFSPSKKPSVEKSDQKKIIMKRVESILFCRLLLFVF